MSVRFVFLAALLAAVPAAAPASESGTEIPMRQVLVMRGAGRAARSAVHTDAIEARIISGQWRAPVAGEALEAEAGAGRAPTWEEATVDKDGWLAGRGTGGAYAWWPVTSPGEQVMVLEAAGHNCVYVNGEIRAGDPYGYGYLHLPVLLRPGTNEFLFQYARGRLRAKLTPPAAPLVLDTADSTLPDLIIGETEPVWGAVVVLNATTQFMTVTLRAEGRSPPEPSLVLPPLSARKCPFQFVPPRFNAPTNCPLRLQAMGGGPGGKTRASASFVLRVRRSDQTHKRTFLSAIDDSVQYYAVNPAPASAPPSGEIAPPALFLSLHGASVEALGQAEAYSPEKWGTIVAPTNRRPYGFDWEEWGRMDALEVLDLARARFHPDPSRIYLTGHSMGGHGAWHLGVLYPDRFAAIGPSAGWISFTSYTGNNPPPATNAIERFLRRSATAGDTLLLVSNCLQHGVYILHGDKDDNVPVGEARRMREVLGRFHHDLEYHEQPGAGHWWDASDEPGTDCVDWAPMFDFFARHAIPADQGLRRVQFVTVNPAVSARAHWVTIAAQERALEPSAVDIRCDPGKRRLVGATTNVARLVLRLPAIAPGPPLTVELDGQRLENIPYPLLNAPHPGPRPVSTQSLTPALSPSKGQRERTGWAEAGPSICLAREAGRWRLGQTPSASLKNPARSGPFRQAFCNHVLFVFATRGTPEENAWALAKARYDAETFGYRGNGSVELMPDTEFCRRCADGSLRPLSPSVQPGAKAPKSRDQNLKPGAPGRNVILYGHADCNAAWGLLLDKSPVQVHRGSVRLGGHELAGTDLACLFLQPNPRDDTALIGVVSGSGLPGLRLTERLPYFLSGAGFPDCLVAGAQMLAKGIDGVRAAGFFGPDWGVESGEFAWAP